MAPSRSPDEGGPLTRTDGELLLDIAEASLRQALGADGADSVAASLTDALQRPTGAFVTLTVEGELNGCIGTMGGAEPLATAIARLARQAAFDDPRLPALRRDQLDALEIEISLLGPLEALPCATPERLLSHLRPGVDGLLLEAGRHRALYLPDVWTQLPDGPSFLRHLLAKAGLPADTWPDVLAAWRFQTEALVRRLGPSGG